MNWKKRKRDKKIKKGRRRFLCVFCFLAVGIVVGIVRWLNPGEKPEQLIHDYMDCIEKKDYDRMYSMLSSESQEKVSQKDFCLRNGKIYEGIEVSNIRIQVRNTEKDGRRIYVFYNAVMDTLAGSLTFDEVASFVREGRQGYFLEWKDSLIFPQLEADDKVRVREISAKRGNIYDRNGIVLAGEGKASLVGLIPGKMSEKPEQDIKKLARLLEIEEDTINKKLEAKWIKEDSFVPIKTMEELNGWEVMSDQYREEAEKKQELKNNLFDIPGVMISETKVREYPLKEAASHLTGYVQNVTAEDLEKHKGEGYTSNSVIGKSGVELLYESKLRGKTGYEIAIVDSSGEETEILAVKEEKNGEDVYLTIDAQLQQELYEEWKEDKSLSAAMNPKTGEVLALVSTPAYDPNDFIRGMSEKQWKSLNEDEAYPLQNRFRAVWCPGSSFKPVIGAIGVTIGSIDPEKDYGQEGLVWQKDKSWGSYTVTTLHTYETANLKNAIIYSDNIYFAKAALKIGGNKLEEALKKLGFCEELPFEIKMTKSQIFNNAGFENEIQLADSGYGQGQILVNPLHLLSIYSAFANGGSMIKPVLLVSDPSEVWKENVFSEEAASEIEESLIQVIEDPDGTGRGCRIEGRTLAGKTGTAEIKASKEDTKGTELGWFVVYTPDEDKEDSLSLITMVEDVKNRGGSGYVTKKEKRVLEQVLSE